MASIVIAIIALVISIFSLILNWKHSELLFRRKEYPVVPIYVPKVSKIGDNTRISTTITNLGPRDIGFVYFTAYICKYFMKKPWCKNEEMENFKINEPYELILTDSFEDDLNERFSNLEFNDGWYFKKRKIKRYKLVFCIRYQPYIADTNFHYRKLNCLIKPVINADKIDAWELTLLPNRLGWLPV
jgi:hypothetical protein